MQAATRIGLLHHVGGGNLGDDATLDAVAGNIKQRWPKAEIVAFSMNPDDTETRHGIRSHPLRRKGWSFGYKPSRTQATLRDAVSVLARKYKVVFRVLKATKGLLCLPSETCRELSFLTSSRRNIKSLELLIISGGGQLTENGGPWGFPYTIFKWVVLARSAGVRCIFLNVGAGPLTRTLSKFFVRKALLASDYVSFRDEKSRKLVYEIGFTGESRVRPDSAYDLDIAMTNGSPGETRAQPLVGFAPMPYPYPDPSAEKDQIVYEKFIRKLANFASWLVDQSYALTFFGTDIGVDPLAIENLQMALLSYHGIPSSQYTVNRSVNSPHDLLATMSRMDFIITCRFHGVVFAHLMNIPLIAISHHPKVATLMNDLGLAEYCLDIDAFDLELLTATFTRMVTNKDSIKARLREKAALYNNALTTQFNQLFLSGGTK